MKITSLVVIFIGILCSLTVTECSENPDSQRIQEIVEQQSHWPIDEYTVFRSPSYPREIEQILPEWASTDCLVMALPYDDAVLDGNLLDFFIEIVKNAIRCVDVILLVDERELISFKEILIRLEAGRLSKYLYKGEDHRIFIIPSRFDTKWIRDYGPFLLFDRQGNPFIADAAYRDVRVGLEPTYTFDTTISSSLNNVFGNIELGQSESLERNEDDSVSMYLAYFLSQKYKKTIPVIRVPFQLCGGEIFFDELGEVFLSSETLFINGGNRLDLELILKHYYGMKNITYLDPLPGDTIKHLDMIFKLVDANTFLVADYPNEVKEEDIYMRYLHDETRRILNENTAVLQERFPNRRIVRMPMPPLKRISNLPDYALELTIHLFESSGYTVPASIEGNSEEWTLERFAFFVYALQKFAEHSEFEAPDILMQILDEGDSQQYSTEEEAMLHHLVEKLISDDPELLKWILESGNQEIESESNLPVTQNALGEYLLSVIFNGLEEDPACYEYVYRTYLNSTFLNGRSRRMLLVPSYSGLEEMEETIRQIYTELYPNTEIVFINSDAIIEQDGAIHCVTITIPKLTP